MIEQIINFIAPHSCLTCEKEGSLLCYECQTLLPTPPLNCCRCGALSGSLALCLECVRPLPLESVQSATQYQGDAKVLIKQLKFERAAAAARSIAQVMAQQFTRRGDDLVVTHVPTATSRQRVRGYDQAALIAREFASLTHLPYMPLLARQGHLRQLGQSRKQRIQQMQQAFRPLKYSRMTQKRVLLIDDVLTTGSSIESAALTLSKSGVQHISAFVFAVADFSWINGQ